MIRQPPEPKKWQMPSAKRSADSFLTPSEGLLFANDSFVLSSAGKFLNSLKGQVAMQAKIPCRVLDLGLIDYEKAYTLQRNFVDEVIGKKENIILLCEHTPVFTLGRIATEENFLLTSDEIKQSGAKVLRVDRGGEVTFHGPGQLVVYPIFQLTDFGKDLKLYMGQLEQVAIDLLRYFGIVADRILGQRGVWVGQEKIASIGIGVRKWVSYHGIGINVNTDLKFFSFVRPCGLNVRMTSISKITNKSVDMAAVKAKAIECFAKNFHLDMIAASLARE